MHSGHSALSSEAAAVHVEPVGRSLIRKLWRLVDESPGTQSRVASSPRSDRSGGRGLLGKLGHLVHGVGRGILGIGRGPGSSTPAASKSRVRTWSAPRDSALGSTHTVRALTPGGSCCSTQPIAPFHAGTCPAVSRASGDSGTSVEAVVAGVEAAEAERAGAVVESAAQPTNATSRATDPTTTADRVR